MLESSNTDPISSFPTDRPTVHLSIFEYDFQHATIQLCMKMLRPKESGLDRWIGPGLIHDLDQDWIGGLDRRLSTMTRDWSYGEALKAVFPLLEGEDLCSCMLVCRQWRDISRDDYLWKCICAKRWPSIIKKPPPACNYYKLFIKFSPPPRPHPLVPANLSFNDLEFYFDLWSEQKLIFSAAVSGPTLRTGIKQPPPGVSESLRAHLENDEYKMMTEVEPMFDISLVRDVSVSLLACRKDTDQIACILHRSIFDYVDGSAFKALAYDYLRFSPSHPFVSGIRAWVSLLFLSSNEDSIFDVFGVEVDFRNAANSENEVLWLLDMLDWK